MTEPTFESHLMSLREQGFWLSNLMEFTMYPRRPWRVALRHKSGPSHLCGLGWGETPFEALYEAKALYDKELLWYNRAPMGKQKMNISLEDLGLV